MSNYVDKKLKAIVENFIGQLEEGTAPWVKPYTGGGVMSLPKNRHSRRPYKGLNVLILWDAMMKNGWEEPYFLTFNQCRMYEDAHVRAGEKGTQIIFWGPKESGEELVDEETGEVSQTFVRRCYTVFNIAQCKNVPTIPKLKNPISLNPDYKNPLVDDFVSRTGARVVHRESTVPAYVPNSDYIIMPREREFVSYPEYYGSLTHELVHWSGAKQRLDRLQECKFGERQYAYEELVAELGAAFLCSYLQVPLEKVSHAEYLGEWVSVLKEHPSILWSASSKAYQAYEYLRDLGTIDIRDIEEDQQAVNQ